MNTANLQLEGLYLAIAAINDALVAKGVLTREEVTEALRSAEESIISGPGRGGDELSPANRDAIVFPIRLLRLANSRGGTGAASFTELARSVGRAR